jgi:hypothetical protein
VQWLLDRAAIHDVIVSSAYALDRNGGGTRHFLNNEVLAVDGDEATAETYLFVTVQQDDGRPSPWNRGARLWIDRLRRTRGRWELVAREEVDTRVADELVIGPEEAEARAGVARRRA